MQFKILVTLYLHVIETKFYVYSSWACQQDAPRHFTPKVREFLNVKFVTNGLGGRGRWPLFWSPPSPDFTPLDLFQWGHVKNNVNCSKPWSSLELLKIEGIEDVTQSNFFSANWRIVSPIVVVMMVDMLKNKKHNNKFKCYFIFVIFTDCFYLRQSQSDKYLKLQANFCGLPVNCNNWMIQ